MPILVTKDDGHPLDQGDLLSGIDLFRTEADGRPGKVSGYLLVLSRPCSATNKKTVLVCQVVTFPVQLPKDLVESGKSVAEFAKMLCEIRDADGSDAMYLGELPGSDDGARYAARLDFVGTVAVPGEPSARGEWVAAHRKAALDEAFRRDLHTRFFLAIAKQGFDDDQWFSDRDLDLLINYGETRLAEAKAAVSAASFEMGKAKAAGTYESQKKRLANPEKAQETADKAKVDLQRFVAERARRQPPAQPDPHNPPE